MERRLKNDEAIAERERCWPRSDLSVKRSPSRLDASQHLFNREYRLVSSRVYKWTVRRPWTLSSLHAEPDGDMGTHSQCVSMVEWYNFTLWR